MQKIIQRVRARKTNHPEQDHACTDSSIVPVSIEPVGIFELKNDVLDLVKPMADLCTHR